MVLVDLRPQGITGRNASDALEEAGILANKNLIPDDPRSPAETSGLRFGTNHLGFMTIDDAAVRALATHIARVLLHLAEPSSQASHQAIADLAAHVSDLTRDACRATDGAPSS
ncbi:MAG: serine hydroxymethyltransferase, partial [Actinobacteria bacterium]|nr:serine hydroxymethyltransferase [Actinomycetota bacterium]